MSDQPEIGGKIALDTTDFKTAIATANREIRVIESGFRASAAALGDWSKDAGGLEQRMKALTQQIGLQQSKVSALQGEYERVAAEKGATSRAAQDLQIKLNRETETLNKMKGELNGTQGALDQMGQESQDTGRQVEELGRKEEATASATDRLRSVTGALGGALKVGVAAVAGLAAAAVGATAAIGGIVLKAADTAGELVDLSEKTGITTTRLQELGYAGDQLGVGAETITGSMARLVRSMSDARDETSDYAEAQAKAAAEGKAFDGDLGDRAKAFDTLGVAITDANGELRSNEDVFADVLAALGGVANETERDALAMELFGKSAQELNPLIKAGAGELARLSDEAHQVGAVMSEENVASLEEFGDELASLKAGFQGVLGELAAAVLPAFRELANWIQTNLPVLVDWLKVQLPIAIQTLSDFWTGTLLPAIQEAWAWMQTSLIPLLQELWGWLETNIPPALARLSEFWTGTLLPAIQEVWGWMSGTLLPFLGGVAETLETVVGGAVSALAEFWSTTLQPALTAIWEFIDTNLMPIFNTLGEILGTVVGLAVEALAGLWQNVLLPALSEVWDFVDKNITPALLFLKEKVIDPLTRALDDGLKKALDSINTALKKLKEWLDKIHLPDWLKPGSPTPFEMGVRGITDALNELNQVGPAAYRRLPSHVMAGAGLGGSGTNLNLGGIQIAINGSGDPVLVKGAAEAGVLRAMRAMGAR